MQRRSGAERKRARELGLRRRRWCRVVTAACLCTAEERRRSGTDQLRKTRWKVSATMTDTDADVSHVHCNRQTQRKDIMPNETTNQSTRCPEQPGAQVQAEQRIPLEAVLELALPVWCRHNSTGVLQLYKILSVRLLTRSASLALHTNIHELCSAAYHWQSDLTKARALHFWIVPFSTTVPSIPTADCQFTDAGAL